MMHEAHEAGLNRKLTLAACRQRSGPHFCVRKMKRRQIGVPSGVVRDGP